MFEVNSGVDAFEHELYQFVKDLKHYCGATLTYPLNGGSDTRRDAREHKLLLSIDRGIPARSLGNCVVTSGWIVQGYIPRTLRGLRFVRYGNEITYWNRRKLRRWQRKRRAVVDLTPLVPDHTFLVATCLNSKRRGR